MPKPLRACICSLLFLLAGAHWAKAQKLLVNEAKRVELQALSSQFSQLYQANHQKALSRALRNGWPITIRKRDGSIVILQGLNELGFPIYLKTDNNTTAAASTNTNTVQPGGSLNLNLSGSSTFLNNTR